MDRFLSLSPEERARTLGQAATRRGLPQGSVEKDFWVWLVLRELFALPKYGDHLTFRGGTSLSKAWGLIDRFSEDIDLTVDRGILGFGGDQGPEGAKSRKEQQRRIERLKLACREMIATQIAPALNARLRELLASNESWSLSADDDDPDRQTLLFAYPRLVAEAAPSYVTPVVKLEFGARADPWPVEPRTVISIVAEVFPALMETPACTVRALRPERTFWEKVMLLHEETFRPQSETRRPRMARHYYDVWRLIKAGVAGDAAADLALFEQVAAHRKVYFRYGWVKYDTMKRGSIRVVPQPDQLAEWRRDYAAMQGEMFVGSPPSFDELLAVINVFQEEFNSA